ncbi:hypothetical protein MJO28_016229 [Puccinia striiformis f. sp. tritici]|uniref:Uncharacterized protein n=1 Tax=Puccinia striiformis f. sp. tritici TaxID=168172 RepID=A0ACC0DMK7_9BASI|nr:hypothetical protein MJO28_016229 [Puccinia striiformis f. sp. tritici]
MGPLFLGLDRLQQVTNLCKCQLKTATLMRQAPAHPAEDLVQHRLHADGEGLGWTQVGCKQKVSTQKESAETASNLSAHEGLTRSQNSPRPEQYRSTPGIGMALDTELLEADNNNESIPRTARWMYPHQSCRPNCRIPWLHYSLVLSLRKRIMLRTTTRSNKAPMIPSTAPPLSTASADATLPGNSTPAPNPQRSNGICTSLAGTTTHSTPSGVATKKPQSSVPSTVMLPSSASHNTPISSFPQPSNVSNISGGSMSSILEGMNLPKTKGCTHKELLCLN